MPELLVPIIAFGIDAAFGAGVAATAVIGGLTVGGLVTGVVTLGLVVGAELLLQKGKGKSGDFQPQLPQSGTVGAQSIGPRFHAVGQLRVGGVFFYREVIPGKLMYGVVMNCGKIDSLIAHLVDDELQVTAPVDYAPYYTAADGKILAPTQGAKFAPTVILIWTKNGIVQQPGPPIAVGRYEFVNATDAGFSSAILRKNVSIWTDAHRAKGLACMYSEWIGQIAGVGVELMSMLQVYPNRYPQHSFIVRGEPIYDPRDPAQSFGDPSTWAWSRNPALIWAYYWTHEDGGNLSYDEIDWDSVILAANTCDRPVAKFGGGTEPYATCDTQFNTSESRSDVEARILASCDGMVYERGGKQAIWIVGDVDPVVTLTAADISRIEWSVTAGALDEVNYLMASYAEPRANYANLASPVIRDAVSIAAVGERAATIQLPAVTNFNQAYRLTHRVMRRRNAPQFVTLTGGPRLLRAAGEFMVTIDAPDYGVSGKFLATDLMSVSGDLSSATIKFRKVADDAFDDVVSPSDPVSPNIGSSGGSAAATVPPPTDIPHTITWDGTPTPYVVAEAWSYQVMPGQPWGVGTPVGHPIDTSLQFFVQSRPVDPGTHAPLGDGSWSADTDGAVIWTDHIDQWDTQSPALVAGASYELRAWFQSSAIGTLSAILAGKFVDIPAGP